jgi:hypothetical protein
MTLLSSRSGASSAESDPQDLPAALYGRFLKHVSNSPCAQMDGTPGQFRLDNCSSKASHVTEPDFNRFTSAFNRCRPAQWRMR